MNKQPKLFSLLFVDSNKPEFSLVDLLTKKTTKIGVPGDLNLTEVKDLLSRVIKTSDEVSIDDQTAGKRITVILSKIDPVSFLLDTTQKAKEGITEVKEEKGSATGGENPSTDVISSFTDVLARNPVSNKEVVQMSLGQSGQSSVYDLQNYSVAEQDWEEEDLFND